MMRNAVLLAMLPVLISAAPAENGRWAYATSTATIGLNPPFLETKLGPAKSKDRTSWTFQVSRCEVTYYIGLNGVTGYSFDLKPGCGSAVSGYQDLRGTMLSSETSFATLQRLNLLRAHFAADCLEGCGNAADPVVSLKAEGSRVSGALDIEFGATLAGTAALKASETWSNAYKQRYGLGRLAYIPADAAACDFSLDRVARIAFAPVMIDSVTVGDTGSLYRPRCDELQSQIAQARQ